MADNLADVRGLTGVPDNTGCRKHRARAAGFNDYLIKPSAAGELEGVLERLLPKKNSALH